MGPSPELEHFLGGIAHFQRQYSELKLRSKALAVRITGYWGGTALQRAPELKIEGYAKYPFLHRRNYC